MSRLLLIAGALAGSLAFKGVPASAQSFDRDELARELLTRFEAMRVLRDEFPNAFETLLNEAQTASSTAEARAAASVWGQEFGQANAVLLRSAPSGIVRDYLSQMRQRIATIRDAIGDARCSRWNTGDPSLAQVIADRFKNLNDRLAALTFRAYAAALDRPVPRNRASDAEWKALRRTYPANGLGELMLATLQANDPDDPAGCQATLRLFDAVLAFDGPGGEAVRASFAEDIARAAAGG